MRIYIIIATLIAVLGITSFVLSTRETEAPSEVPEVTENDENVAEENNEATEENEENVEVESEEESTEESATQAPPPAPTPTPTPTPVPQAEPPKPLYAALVTYTSSGFQPNKVTIEEGQIVRFVNAATHGMWVASDIHPRHSQYQIKTDNDCLGSKFDQCEAVENGEFWDFKFDLEGSWDFHNHVRAKYGGTVFVEEPE